MLIFQSSYFYLLTPVYMPTKGSMRTSVITGIFPNSASTVTQLIIFFFFLLSPSYNVLKCFPLTLNFFSRVHWSIPSAFTPASIHVVTFFTSTFLQFCTLFTHIIFFFLLSILSSDRFHFLLHLLLLPFSVLSSFQPAGTCSFLRLDFFAFFVPTVFSNFLIVQVFFIFLFLFGLIIHMYFIVFRRSTRCTFLAPIYY